MATATLVFQIVDLVMKVITIGLIYTLIRKEI